MADSVIEALTGQDDPPLNGITDFDLPQLIIRKTIINRLTSSANVPIVRHGLQKLREFVENTPREMWKQAGYTPAEGEEIVREEARREIQKRTRLDRRQIADLLNTYLPKGVGGHSAVNSDGFLRTVDVGNEDLNPPHLIDGVIPAASVGFLIAPFGMGKTFLSIALGYSVAFGEPWLGEEVNETGPVRFIAAEGRRTFPIREAGWLVEHEYLPESFTQDQLAEARDGRVMLTDGILRLDDPRLEDALLRTVEAEGTKLIVLDTLGRLLGPEQSEDSNDTANQVMGVLQAVAQETGVTFLIVHHPGHDDQERSRGGSAWEQAADFAFSVGGSRSDVKHGRPVRLKNRKERDDGILDEDLGYKLTPVAMTLNGGSQDTLVAEGGVVTPEPTLAEEIRAHVQDNPGKPKGFIQNVVEKRDKDVSAEIDRMLAEGKLEDRSGDGPGYELHDVPEAWPENVGFDADQDPADLSDVTGEEPDGGDGE